MVDNPSQHLDSLFHALADPTRRALLKSLAQREQTISVLAAPFAMSLEAVSKHVKVLERAGLVERTIEGRTHVCRLNAAPMHGGLEWIRHYQKYWTRKLDVLEDLLKSEDRAAGTGRSRRKPKSPRSKR